MSSITNTKYQSSIASSFMTVVCLNYLKRADANTSVHTHTHPHPAHLMDILKIVNL